jgi:hypothetical protein
MRCKRSSISGLPRTPGLCGSRRRRFSIRRSAVVSARPSPARPPASWPAGRTVPWVLSRCACCSTRCRATYFAARRAPSPPTTRPSPSPSGRRIEVRPPAAARLQKFPVHAVLAQRAAGRSAARAGAVPVRRPQRGSRVRQGPPLEDPALRALSLPQRDPRPNQHPRGARVFWRSTTVAMVKVPRSPGPRRAWDRDLFDEGAAQH